MRLVWPEVSVRLAGYAALALAVVAAGGTAAVAQTTTAPSVLAGAYTEEQALRGQSLYYAHCLACHGETMAGLDQAPPLAGPQFASNWVGAPLRALVDRIGTMPPDNPAVLSRAEHVDILSYMLWYNGLPIGDVALATEQRILAVMTYETPPPGP
jgi:quinoprotein glucose dehydrogenase